MESVKYKSFIVLVRVEALGQASSPWLPMATPGPTDN